MSKFVCFTLVFLFAFETIYSQEHTAKSAFKDVYISKNVPKPKLPPNIVLESPAFTDQSNNILDANESGKITFNIINNGPGTAYAIKVKCSLLEFNSSIQLPAEVNEGDLQPDTKKTVSLPISADNNLSTGKASIKIIVTEGNNFNPDTIILTINTYEFKKPKLVIADHLFTNNNGEGTVKLGQITNLKIIVQNKGQGKANNVAVTCQYPQNVFPSNEISHEYDSLAPNESKIINFGFFVNTAYKASEIPIQISITENYGKYGEEKTLSVSMTQMLSKTVEIREADVVHNEVQITDVSLVSDIDKDIPVNQIQKENRYALVIGNEDYTSYQVSLNSEVNVDYAINDAQTFKTYCTNVFGIPGDNITMLTNATAAKMRAGIEKMKLLLKNSQGIAEVIVYYAGHGLPNEETKDAFLIPVDVNPADLNSAISLRYLYESLSQYPSSRVTILLDACFSGGGRHAGLVAARSVKIKPKEVMLNGNIVVFAATSGEQTALPYSDKQHGLFTYFLLKKIKETGGRISYGELSDYLNSKVALESVKINNKEQVPVTRFSEELNDTWKNWYWMD